LFCDTAGVESLTHWIHTKQVFYHEPVQCGCIVYILVFHTLIVITF
jgi:hypothetical protein